MSNKSVATRTKRKAKKEKTDEEKKKEEEEKRDPEELKRRTKKSANRHRFSKLSVLDAQSVLTDLNSNTDTLALTAGKQSLASDGFTDRRSELSEKFLGSLASDPHSVYNKAYEGITFNLKNINLKIKKGQCVALIGKVGSGKSSLLSCLGGELYHKLGAKITVCGSKAYVAQKAWIQSKTIKENILFGLPFDKQRYKNSIKYSCMTDDLKILNKQDETLLGDKGVNLSGGQKIRLSIARAMYSDSDIYLFDDPISALDIHVGKYVMEEGILDFLKGSTRVVATHAIAYLKLFDYIYLLDEGEIIEEGTYEEITQSQAFKDIEKTLKDTKAEEEEKKKKEEEEKQRKEENKTETFDNQPQNADPIVTESEAIFTDNDTSVVIRKAELTETDANATAGPAKEGDSVMLDDIKDEQQKKIIEDIIACEDRTEGNMSGTILSDWANLIGGFPRIMFIFIVLTVSMFSKAGIPWFLQWWSTNFSGAGQDLLYQFMGLYVSINVVTIVCDYLRSTTNFAGNLEMSREVNFKMTYQLMHASINKFFDRIPLGRILNRFMKDIEQVDMYFPWTSNWFLISK